MRKIVCVLLAICCCLCLVSCGVEKSPKAPDDKLIQADLEEEITYYKDFLSLKEFEIQQSLTEETEYSATISAVAESAYAEFELTADVVYTKYDQGWGLDSCDWQELGYSVVNYPDEAAFTEWIQSGLGQSDEGWKSQEVVLLDTNEESVSVHGQYVNNSGGRIEFVHTVTSLWEYESETDCWNYNHSGTVDEMKIALNNIEGEYPSITGCGSIIISNVTDDGFDVCDTAFNTNTVHVSYLESRKWFAGSGVTYNIEFAGASGTDANVAVRFEKDSMNYMILLDDNNYIDTAEMN